MCHTLGANQFKFKSFYMHSSINNIRAIIKHYFIPSNENMFSRRFDLDWLRVGVFGLLIFYHIGMLYVVNWEFHFKSQYQWQGLEMLMLLVSPWRMAILWFISGVAIRFLLVKVSIEKFIFLRSIRLLLPLLFGILVIVPPQLYVEMTQKSGLDLSYWEFLLEFFSANSSIFTSYQAGIWPHIDVNHLWYLRSLWQFSLILICLLPLLNANKTEQFIDCVNRSPAPLALIIYCLPVFLLHVFWDAETRRYPLGFLFMIYGYLNACSPSFWQQLRKHLPNLLKITPLVLALFVCFYQFMWLPYGETAHPMLQLAGLLTYSVSRVLGVFTLLALAYTYLNKNSPKLSYWSQGVYAFYILHQSIIIVLGFVLSQIDLGRFGFIIEPVLVTAGTISGCMLCYETIRRSSLLRPLFGMKQAKSYPQLVRTFGYTIAFIIILPLILTLASF